MALFGHDDNVRRLEQRSSVILSDNEDGSRCTTAKVKSCLKVFFAQLFSHVGLCALVVGYSIMGAFIFAYLESEKEMNTRKDVENTRTDTLKELYNITGTS